MVEPDVTRFFSCVRATVDAAETLCRNWLSREEHKIRDAQEGVQVHPSTSSGCPPTHSVRSTPPTMSSSPIRDPNLNSSYLPPHPSPATTSRQHTTGPGPSTTGRGAQIPIHCTELLSEENRQYPAADEHRSCAAAPTSVSKSSVRADAAPTRPRSRESIPPGQLPPAANRGTAPSRPDNTNGSKPSLPVLTNKSAPPMPQSTHPQPSLPVPTPVTNPSYAGGVSPLVEETSELLPPGRGRPTGRNSTTERTQSLFLVPTSTQFPSASSSALSSATSSKTRTGPRDGADGTRPAVALSPALEPSTLQQQDHAVTKGSTTKTRTPSQKKKLNETDDCNTWEARQSKKRGVNEDHNNAGLEKGKRQVKYGNAAPPREYNNQVAPAAARARSKKTLQELVIQVGGCLPNMSPRAMHAPTFPSLSSSSSTSSIVVGTAHHERSEMKSGEKRRKTDDNKGQGDTNNNNNTHSSTRQGHAEENKNNPTNPPAANSTSVVEKEKEREKKEEQARREKEEETRKEKEKQARKEKEEQARMEKEEQARKEKEKESRNLRASLSNGTENNDNDEDGRPRSTKTTTTNSIVGELDTLMNDINTTLLSEEEGRKDAANRGVNDDDDDDDGDDSESESCDLEGAMSSLLKEKKKEVLERGSDSDSVESESHDIAGAMNTLLKENNDKAVSQHENSHGNSVNNNHAFPSRTPALSSSSALSSTGASSQSTTIPINASSQATTIPINPSSQDTLSAFSSTQPEILSPYTALLQSSTGVYSGHPSNSQGGDWEASKYPAGDLNSWTANGDSAASSNVDIDANKWWETEGTSSSGNWYGQGWNSWDAWPSSGGFPSASSRDNGDSTTGSNASYTKEKGGGEGEGEGALSQQRRTTTTSTAEAQDQLLVGGRRSESEERKEDKNARKRDHDNDEEDNDHSRGIGERKLGPQSGFPGTSVEAHAGTSIPQETQGKVSSPAMEVERKISSVQEKENTAAPPVPETTTTTPTDPLKVSPKTRRRSTLVSDPPTKGKQGKGGKSTGKGLSTNTTKNGKGKGKWKGRENVDDSKTVGTAAVAAVTEERRTASEWDQKQPMSNQQQKKMAWKAAMYGETEQKRRSVELPPPLVLDAFLGTRRPGSSGKKNAQRQSGF